MFVHQRLASLLIALNFCFLFFGTEPFIEPGAQDLARMDD